jgi:DNA-binding NarL/FixJ family response regulator
MLQHSESLNVVLVDDHPVVVEGLQKILATAFTNAVLKDFTSGEDFMDYLSSEERLIDLVLLDITLPGKSGIEICQTIKLISPSTIIIAFSNHAERSIILKMIQNGASGYILKNAGAQEMLTCIEEVLSGQISFSAEVKKIMARPSPEDVKEMPSISKREKQILQMIGEGKTSVEIAAELFLSPLTVETHRRNLMQKFDVKNAATLMKMAIQKQII